MHHAYQRLSFPASFRDLVRQLAHFRRYTLYVYAWFQWHIAILGEHLTPPIPRLPIDSMMGCFTLCPIVAQELLSANIPVWFIRRLDQFSGSEIIMRAVSLQPPVLHLSMSTAVATSMKIQLSGRLTCLLPLGDSHLEWINRQSGAYLDIEKHPYSLPSLENVAETTPGRVRSQNIISGIRHHPCTSL